MPCEPRQALSPSDSRAMQSADLKPSPRTSSHFGVEHFFQTSQRFTDLRLNKILIVGCGAGGEVVDFQKCSEAITVGFDLDGSALRHRDSHAVVVIADVHHIPFPSQFFEAVFTYHVLEHVGDVHSAVEQIFRVLRPGGILYIGVPNKSRLVSVGDRGDEARPGKAGKVIDMLESNLIDYHYRLGGRFENDRGAHAGFTKEEMKRILAPYFEDMRDLTCEYLRGKYERWGALARLATSRLWLYRLAPSIYVVCRRRKNAGRSDHSEK